MRARWAAGAVLAKPGSPQQACEAPGPFSVLVSVSHWQVGGARYHQQLNIHPVTLGAPLSRDLRRSWAWHPLAQMGDLPTCWGPHSHDSGGTGGQEGLPERDSRVVSSRGVRLGHRALPTWECGRTAPTVLLAAIPPCPRSHTCSSMQRQETQFSGLCPVEGLPSSWSAMAE